MRRYSLRSLAYFYRMKRLWLLLLMLPSMLSAQETDDFYAPEQAREPVTVENVKQLYRWGPKLGLEVHAAVSYNHLQMPMSLMGAFEKASGGAGFDGGGGIRVRLYHKLSMAAGFNFAIRNFSLGYQAMDVDTVNPQTYQVEENVTQYLMGFYQKTIIELSRRLHLAQTFQYTWLHRYAGEAYVENLTTPGAGPGTIELDRPLLDGWSTSSGQAELGLEFAYKIHVANELIVKPYIGAGYVFSPAVHTGLMLQGFFGESEQNPSFINLRIGVIMETGLWLDGPRSNRRKPRPPAVMGID